MSRGRFSALAVVIGAVPLLAGCSSMEADIPLVEREIREGVEDQLGYAVFVDCPSEVKWQVGETFRCAVEEMETGATVLATVTMENDVGDFTVTTAPQ